jgi:hypothetical protein
MASKAASLLRRAFQLVFAPLLLVDQRAHARGLSVGPESRIVLVIEPQQLAEPPATAWTWRGLRQHFANPIGVNDDIKRTE